MSQKIPKERRSLTTYRRKILTFLSLLSKLTKTKKGYMIKDVTANVAIVSKIIVNVISQESCVQKIANVTIVRTFN